jgi:hypothetical protein
MMLNTLRFMSHLVSVVMLLLGAGILSTVSFANPLTEDDRQFKTQYLESCLSGMERFGIPSTQSQTYCSCTADQILSLDREKLEALDTMKPEDLQANLDLRQIVMACWQPLLEGEE